MGSFGECHMPGKSQFVPAVASAEGRMDQAVARTAAALAHAAAVVAAVAAAARAVVEDVA